MSSLRGKWPRIAELAATVDLGSARTPEIRELAALAGEAAREALDAEARSTLGADVVERLRQAFVDGQANMPADPDLDPEEDARAYGEALDRAGIRAVLSHLAATGEEVWPSDLWKHVLGTWDRLDKVGSHDEGKAAAMAVDALYRSRLALILGALRAENASIKTSIGTAVNGASLLHARVAELEAENTDKTLRAADALERAQRAERRVADLETEARLQASRINDRDLTIGELRDEREQIRTLLVAAPNEGALTAARRVGARLDRVVALEIEVANLRAALADRTGPDTERT